jgi:hypothetical protein
MVYSFQKKDKFEIDKDNPWSGVLAAVIFAIRATYYTTTQAIPTQLVFGRDAILNTNLMRIGDSFANGNNIWLIKTIKRKTNKKNPHHYKVRDKILYLIHFRSTVEIHMKSPMN